MEELTRDQILRRSDQLAVQAQASPQYTDILEADKLLCSLSVPHMMIRLLDGWQMIYWPEDDERIGDVVQNSATEGKMMAYGFDLPDGMEMEVDIDEVIAMFETAHELYLKTITIDM